MYRHLQLAVHAHDMFCRPIKIQSFDDQTSRFICPLWNFLALLHKPLKGSKVDQQCVRAFCVWSFENQNEWNSCFWSGCLFNSPQKNTDSHIVIQQVRTLWFRSWLQRWPVFPSAKAASFILAEVSSSCFHLTFVSSRLDFSCFFSSMNFSHVLSNLHLLVGEETSLVFSLYAMFTRVGTRSTVCARRRDLFSCRRFQIWFGALHVTAVLTLLDASLLFTLRCFYRKIMFKTGLLWPLHFRVDSRYRLDNVEVKTFFP